MSECRIYEREGCCPYSHECHAVGCTDGIAHENALADIPVNIDLGEE